MTQSIKTCLKSRKLVGLASIIKIFSKHVWMGVPVCEKQSNDTNYYLPFRVNITQNQT